MTDFVSFKSKNDNLLMNYEHTQSRFIPLWCLIFFVVSMICLVNDTFFYIVEICKFGVFLLEMMIIRRDQEEFDGGDAGFIRFIRTLHPEDLYEMIDERMEVTETTLNQVKQVLSLGLMCIAIDQSNSEQPSLAQIFNTLSRAYNANQKVFHGNRVKGHKHIQFR